MSRLLLSLLAAVSWIPSALSQADLAQFDRTRTVGAYDREGVHHATCDGRVVDENGAPVPSCRVLLYDYVPFYWGLVVAETRTDENGRFELAADQSSGNVVIWAVSPADRPFATRWKDITMVSGVRTDAGRIELQIPADDPFEAVRLRGRVLDADGDPIAGALVTALGAKDRFDPGAAATTTEDGSFAILQRAGCRDKLRLFLPNQRIEIEHKAEQARLHHDGYEWNLDLSQEDLLLQHGSFVTFKITPVGLDGDLARCAAARDTHWIDLPNRSVTLRKGRFGTSTRVRVTAPGHLPRVVDVNGNVDATFGDEVPFQLRVTAAGKPLLGARIDVCQHDPDALFRETVLETITAGSQGRVELLGKPDDTCVVYAYAKGHAPARAIWRSGEATHIELVPTSARLQTVLSTDAYSVFVRLPGSFALAATAYPEARELSIPLAPGRYEVTVYGSSGVAAMQLVELANGQSLELTLDIDQRSSATVTLPKVPKAEADAEWWVFASRRRLGGMVSKWLARSGGGRARWSRMLDAEVEPVAGKERTFRVRFPVSGAFSIQCGHGSLPHRYFADVNLAPGESTELTLPALDATLTGQMSEFPEAWSFGAQHGIAGPRLMLRPDRSKGTQWGVLVALPEPMEFSIDQLPAGHFGLSHHLYETGMFVAEDGHHGETAIELAATTTTAVGKLGKDGGTVRVRLQTPDSRRITGTLRVRDRMFDSWNAVVQEGTTLRYAMDPIPHPPAVELVDGRAELERIRAGPLECILFLPDRHVWFERSIRVAEENVWTLDLPALSPRDR